MALQDIIQKILDDAEMEAKALLDSSRIEADGLLAQSAVDAEATNAAIEKKGEGKISQLHKKVENLARHEQKTRTLQVKRGILDKAFTKAKDDIMNLPDQQKKDILVNMITHIDSSKGVIHPTQGEEKIIESALKDSKKSFTIGKSVPGKGGFLFVAPTSEIDFRFDVIIERELLKKMESEVSQLLFAA